MKEKAKIREKILNIAEIFRQKGAISPQKAMTLEDLNLPPRFKYLMSGPMGKLDIFKEIKGKYYISEEKLTPIEKQHNLSDSTSYSRQRLFSLKITRITTIVLLITLLLVNLSTNIYEIKLLSLIFLVVLIVITFLRLYYLTKIKKKINNLKSAH
jgi:hypothetical protein